MHVTNETVLKHYDMAHIDREIHKHTRCPGHVGCKADDRLPGCLLHSQAQAIAVSFLGMLCAPICVTAVVLPRCTCYAAGMLGCALTRRFQRSKVGTAASELVCALCAS